MKVKCKMGLVVFTGVHRILQWKIYLSIYDLASVAGAMRLASIGLNMRQRHLIGPCVWF